MDDSMVPFVMRRHGNTLYPKNATDCRPSFISECTDASSDAKSTSLRNETRKKTRFNPNNKILEQFNLKEDARQKRHDDKMEEMKTIGKGRKKMWELKKKENALHEEKN